MPICTFVLMYVSRRIYSTTQSQEIRWSFRSGSIHIYNYRQRGGARRREEREEGREERKGSARSQAHLSSSPFSEAAARIICDLLPPYKTMPRATVYLQRGANAKKDRPLADLLRT